jgi:hypothetical protein
MSYDKERGPLVGNAWASKPRRECGARENYEHPHFRSGYRCLLEHGHNGSHVSSDGLWRRGNELRPEAGCMHTWKADRCCWCGTYARRDDL